MMSDLILLLFYSCHWCSSLGRCSRFGNDHLKPHWNDNGCVASYISSKKGKCPPKPKPVTAEDIKAGLRQEKSHKYYTSKLLKDQDVFW